MPQAAPTGLRLGIVEPRDAVAAFTERKLLPITYSWQELWHEEHQRAFTVSRLTHTGLLEFMRDELGKALAEGTSLADFRKAAIPRLQAAGWWGTTEVTDPTTGEILKTKFDPARLKLIYDTNLRQSRAAGRWASIERNKKTSPYVMYRTMRDERVRNSHRPWDSLALPVDHPFWNTHYPPCGWGCRCHAFGISQAELERRIKLGEAVKTEAPAIQYVAFRNKHSGRTEFVPRGIDPGFAYNPGKALGASAPAQLGAKLDAAAPAIARAVVAQTVQSAEFAAFVAAPAAGSAMPVALLDAAQAKAIGATERTVMLSAETALKQATRHPEIAAADYAFTQRVIDTGERLQDGANMLVFIGEIDGMVAVVKATRTGEGLFLLSLRRLSARAAKADSEIRRLRGKAGEA